LPLLVGKGAERTGHDFLAVVDRYPDIRGMLRASVLIAERRWNLRLNNGVDVRLPETDVEQALDRLVTLDREKKLLSRDIAGIDLRLPDRVTVRLSDGAAQAREDALKDKKKKKGGDA
jgi:cell division protein FtsQ